MNRAERENMCSWTQERLDFYLEGELPAAEVGRLETHLKSCDACETVWAAVRQLERDLSGLPELHCPPQVLEEVEAERWAALRRRLQQWFEPLWRPALGFALVAVLAVLFSPKLQKEVAAPESQEVALAERQARFALAYVARVSRRTGYTVRDEVIGQRVVAPMVRGAQSALDGKAM